MSTKKGSSAKKKPPKYKKIKAKDPAEYEALHASQAKVTVHVLAGTDHVAPGGAEAANDGQLF
ncbi:hypothetical protein DPMN_096719 [Dreissena polymorpha]|uniref:Uncharacterized protein n=1 Tax=Dreissena polymorpha TaxID=45954 RepID=A0A9D4L9Q6_DREPO|nr:hypothetical protein DPMN_096719 [Dreissena polymorpha]